MLKAIDHAFDAVSEMYYVEVDEQAQLLSGEFQIGEELGFVNGKNGFESLELNYYRILDEQIQPVTGIEFYAPINDRKFHLRLYAQPSIG